MELGDRLRSLREKKDLTQTEFAKRMKLPNQNISNYERGFRQPDYETLKRFADYFEVSVDFLLGRTENPNYIDFDQEDDEKIKIVIIDKIKREFPDAELMFNDLAGFTADDMQDVYDYIKFKKGQKKGDD